MFERFFKFRFALDFYSIRSLVQGSDHNTGVDELSFDSSRGVTLVSSSIVVNNGHEIVANVPFLLVTLRIGLGVVRHQGGHVENHLHEVVLPHVGVVPVALLRIEASQKRSFAVNITETYQGSKAVQKVRVSQRPEGVSQNGLFVVRLSGSDV